LKSSLTAEFLNLALPFILSASLPTN